MDEERVEKKEGIFLGGDDFIGVSYQEYYWTTVLFRGNLITADRTANTK